jgi:hypothetical protein
LVTICNTCCNTCCNIRSCQQFIYVLYGSAATAPAATANRLRGGWTVRVRVPAGVLSSDPVWGPLCLLFSFVRPSLGPTLPSIFFRQTESGAHSASYFLSSDPVWGPLCLLFSFVRPSLGPTLPSIQSLPEDLSSGGKAAKACG